MQAPASQRPTGITILAILAAIAGVLGILGGIAVIGLSSLVASTYGGFYSLIGYGILIISVGELAFAYGAWTLKPWAWTLGIAVEIINIVLEVLWITQGASIGSVLINVIVSLIVLYYLDTPAVRTAFGQNPKSIAAGMMNRSK